MTLFYCVRCGAAEIEETLGDLPGGQCAGGHEKNSYHGWARAERLRVEYVEVDQDFADQSMSFSEPKTFEMDVGRTRDDWITGTDDQGRHVSVPTGGIKSINARPADRDDGSYSVKVGNRRGITVIEPDRDDADVYSGRSEPADFGGGESTEVQNL